MKVLLSIKPKYASAILSGCKKYEFRKVTFKREVNEVLIYASAPTKKIVGTFTFENIIENKPITLWKDYKKQAGIGKKEFFNYFEGKKVGFAIEVDKVKQYKKPIEPNTIFPNFIAPQSFCYI